MPNDRRGFLHIPLALLLVLSLFLLSGFLLYGYYQNNKSGVMSSEDSSSPFAKFLNLYNPAAPAEPPSTSALVVFSQSEKPSFYDLSTKSIVNPQRVYNYDENYKSISIGKVSPDGRYLPIQFHHLGGPYEIVLYDTLKNTISSVVDKEASGSSLLYTSASTFWFDHTWTRDNKLNLSPGPKSLESTEFVEVYVDLNGSVSTKTLDNRGFFGNKDIVFEELKNEDMTNKYKVLDAPSGVGLEFKEWPVGFMDGKVLALENPVNKTLEALFSLDPSKWDTITETENIENEFEKEFLTQTFYGHPKLYVYDPAKKELINSFDVKLPQDTLTWTVYEAQINPLTKKLIVMQVDVFTLPQKTRFLEVDKDSGSSKELISVSFSSTGASGVGGPAGQQLLGRLAQQQYFGITQDGNWLVYYKMVTLENGLWDLAIDAKNFSTGETISICTAQCGNLRVYNSYRIDRVKY